METILPVPHTMLNQPTVSVAQGLIGALLKIVQPANDLAPAQTHWVRIVETEAYRADNDPACHAYQRQTGRAAMLYQPAGTVYVYLIYGMYHCLNIVTEAQGVGAAVLIRAVEPLTDLSLKTNGPGRLCKALHITQAQHNGLNALLPESPIQLFHDPTLQPKEIVTTTRIGITKGVELPWRFYEQGNPWVSKVCQLSKPSRQTKKATQLVAFPE